jgi:superoxide dismutase, Fe-Mn family
MELKPTDMMTRREALKTTLIAAAATAAAPNLMPLGAQTPPPPAGPFKLAPLPYAADALEPHLDARTMEIHHGKHHAAYVANLNKAVADHADLAAKSAEELVRGLPGLPEKVRTAVRNNGGGHFNHTLFWQMMSKNGGGEPKGDLGRAIEKSFGGYAAFKEQFAKAALGQFGSGWAWLTLDGRELRIEATANQDNPVTQGRVPLLGVDVWEHAYYLKYQNRRADYVAAFYNVIHWGFVAERYAKAMG